jgi:SET domain-containing protein
VIAGGKPTRAELRDTALPFVLRKSPIAGYGAFAVRRIRKGQRIIEYVGEIISQEESDRRYPDNGRDNHHTFLFEIDEHRVIDASYNGNAARFINHSCDPNCEAIDEEGRIFIFARRNIQPGKELAYDYSYAPEKGDDAEAAAQYPCYCGAKRCRGTIMELPPKRRRKNRKKGKNAKNGKQAKRTKRAKNPKRSTKRRR